MLMIVDDDPVFLEKAQEVLDRGRGIFLASDCRHARQLVDILGSGLSVALIDLDLPGEDGFSLIRDLHRRCPHLALIAISGVMQREVLESAKAIGAAEAWPKPVTSDWNSALAAIRGGQ